MKVDIVFDGMPGPEGPRLIEVEDGKGKSTTLGDWVVRPDGYHALRFNQFDPVEAVEAFHRKFAINYEGKPRALSPEVFQFRMKFIREEATEYEDHMLAAQAELSMAQEENRPVDNEAMTAHLDGALDALGDLVYVVLGTAHLQGFDIRTAFERIHAANMNKERSPGEPKSVEERLKLKIIKPPGWEAPDHRDLVQDNAHGDQS